VSGFRTSLCHSCFSADLGEPQPKICKCRKLVTRDKAVQMVAVGEAQWLVDYRGEVPVPTWNLVYTGRTAKTPRAHTLERSHIERSLERRDQIADAAWLSDEGTMAQNIQMAAMGEFEQMELFELYHDLEMEERYKLFGHDTELGKLGRQLQEHKKFSDSFGTVEGDEARYVTEIITSRADELKVAASVDDPYEGRTLFPMIGFSQRTKS
jgi:hypothetical protein